MGWLSEAAERGTEFRPGPTHVGSNPHKLCSCHRILYPLCFLFPHLQSEDGDGVHPTGLLGRWRGCRALDQGPCAECMLPGFLCYDSNTWSLKGKPSSVFDKQVQLAHSSEEGLNTSETSTPFYAPAVCPILDAEGPSEGTAVSTLDLHPWACQGQEGRNDKGLWAPRTVADGEDHHPVRRMIASECPASLQGQQAGTVLRALCVQGSISPFPHTLSICVGGHNLPSLSFDAFSCTAGF